MPHKFHIGDVVRYHDPANDQYHGSVGIVVDLFNKMSGSPCVVIMDRKGIQWSPVPETCFHLVGSVENQPNASIDQAAEEYEQAMEGAKLLS